MSHNVGGVHTRYAHLSMGVVTTDVRCLPRKQSSRVEKGREQDFSSRYSSKLLTFYLSSFSNIEYGSSGSEKDPGSSTPQTPPVPPGEGCSPIPQRGGPTVRARDGGPTQPVPHAAV